MKGEILMEVSRQEIMMGYTITKATEEELTCEVRKKQQEKEAGWNYEHLHFMLLSPGSENLLSLVCLPIKLSFSRSLLVSVLTSFSF